MNGWKYVKLSLVLFVLVLSVSVRADVSAQFSAGTTTGWDFYGLAADIARNNTIDENDLNVLAQHWLNTGCDSTNQWCGKSDLDSSSYVDFIDYSLLANNWYKQAGQGVLLQTIYGTSQDSNGIIIPPNSAHALSMGKECLMVFAVQQDTKLDKGWFKLTGFKAGYTFRVRLFNVTGQGLLNTGHTIAKASLDSSTPLIDITLPTGSPVPSHPEGTQNATDLIVNFGPLPVTAGEYMIVFNNLGSGNTIGSIVRGLGTAGEPANMGKYSDGTPLPKCATVTTASVVGNTYFYYLSTSSAANYQPISNLLAFQITTSTVNGAPVVNAGIDQTIINPINLVNLNGTVTDDDLPESAIVTTQWAKQSGPGEVTFGDANSIDTTAAFSAYGVYVLRLTANDSALSSYDEVQITYLETAPPNQAPVANAGSDQTVASPASANLDGTVTDDGMPNPPGVVTTTWSKQSGPGTVTFGNASSIDTTAAFSAVGTYVLRLTANDGALSSYDEVTITYTEATTHPQNEPPVVNAGYNQVVTLGNTITINAIVTPSNASKSWSKVSGPGSVSFGSGSSATTTVSFSAVGTYVLRLTGTSNGFTITDDITVVVQAGNIYHVATSGSDSANGSSGTPWKTLQHAVDTVSAGDTILVHAGTYNQKIIFNKSGSASGGYIILRNYGSDVPIIDGTGTERSGELNLITLTHESYICVFGFEMQNMNTPGRDYTPVGVAAWGQCDHIYICGNNIHNITNAMLGGNAHGICFYGDSTTSSNNIWIEDNQVHDCRLGTSESLVLNGNVEIFTVKDNIVHDNDNIGIDFIGFEGHGSPDQARNGSCIRNTVYNIDFSKNANFQSYGGSKNADGIYTDGGTNLIIEKNIVHNCNLGIEAASEHHGMTTDYITVRSNLVYNCDVGGLFFGGYDTSVGAAANCTFVNNTLYNNNIDHQGWGGEIVMQWHCTNNVVKNNAIYATAGQMLIDNPDTGGSNNVYDYNIYYGAGVTWLWKNVEYTTFAAYKAASGNETHSQNTDPGFADIPNLDLHIWPGSACVNAGDPSLTYTNLQDIDGQTRKQGANADIGADENQ